MDIFKEFSAIMPASESFDLGDKGTCDHHSLSFLRILSICMFLENRIQMDDGLTFSNGILFYRFSVDYDIYWYP